MEHKPDHSALWQFAHYLTDFIACYDCTYREFENKRRVSFSKRLRGEIDVLIGLCPKIKAGIRRIFGCSPTRFFTDAITDATMIAVHLESLVENEFVVFDLREERATYRAMRRTGTRAQKIFVYRRILDLGTPEVRPTWDGMMLSYGGAEITRLGKQATTCKLILDALQAAGWPIAPVPINALTDEQLKDGIRQLNSKQTQMQFSRENGRLRWVYLGTPRTPPGTPPEKYDAKPPRTTPKKS